jgi:hypothetical protein
MLRWRKKVSFLIILFVFIVYWLSALFPLCSPRPFSSLISGLSNQITQKVTMQIFVGSTAYQVDPATSVESFKLQIENAEFVPARQICLVSGAKVLEGGSLEGNGLEEDDTLQMRLAVDAGMRAKWRKKRMRRLRRKRRKMRQRAR